VVLLTTIELASTIVKKYERALREQAEISVYFTDLTQSSPQHLIPVWTRDIEHAEATRQDNVKNMDYMNPKVEKRVYPPHPPILHLNNRSHSFDPSPNGTHVI